MTHGPSLAAPGAAPQPPPTAHDAPRRVRGLRRFGAAALAAGTFVGLGALIGPVGVASATSDPAVVAVVNAFAVGGTLTLPGDVAVPTGTTLGEGKRLVLDLGGHKLTVQGADGGNASDTDLESASPGIANLGTLIITNGSLEVNGGGGGTGGPGGDGTGWSTEGTVPGAAGGDGGDGGNGIDNSGYLYITATITIREGSGANGGKAGNGGQCVPMSDGVGGVGAAGGDGGSAGDGGVGISNVGLLVANPPSESNYTTGLDGSAGANGVAGASCNVALLEGPAGTPGVAGDSYQGWPAESMPQLVFEPGSGSPSPAQLTAFGGFDGDTAKGLADGLDAALAGYWSTAVTGTSRWLNADNSAVSADPLTGQTIHLGAVSSPPQPNPAPVTTSTAAPVTTSTTAPVTTSKPVPATTTSTPSATTPSIPTNNLATPETFVSSSAPAPQPLPGVSQVDDSSASQFDVDTHNPTQGGDLTLTAKGFKPGTVVDFWMHSTPVYLGSAIADIHGIAVLPVKLTPALVGDHHVQSIGTGLLGEPRNLAQPITIDATPALASTGVATAPLTFLAVLLLAGGAALVLADRRRAGQAAHGARTGNRA